MDVATFLTKTNYAYRGLDDDAPSFGSEEAIQWLSILNSKKDDYYRDTKQKWQESFRTTAPNEPGTVATTGTTTLTGTNTYFTDYQAGDTILVDGETSRVISTITSNTVLAVTVAFSNTVSAETFTHTSVIASSDQTYAAHRSLLVPSDQIEVTKTNGQIGYYDVIKPQTRDIYTQQVHVTGINPRLLTFTNTIASTDPIVGGTIAVPGYYLPNDLTASTDLLPFVDPEWAVVAVAAELAFNDIVYEDKAADLTEKANYLYRQVAMANRSGTYRDSRNIPINTYRIKQPRRYA